MGDADQQRGGPRQQDQYYDEVIFDAPPSATVLALLRDWLPRVRTPGTALELGCGTGRMLLVLASLFELVYGIDSSHSRAKCASKRAEEAGATNVRVICGDAMSVMPVEAQPDKPRLVLAMYLVSHLSEKATLDLVALARTWAGPKGLVLLVDHVSGAYQESWSDQEAESALRLAHGKTYQVLKRFDAVGRLTDELSHAVLARRTLAGSELLALRGGV